MPEVETHVVQLFSVYNVRDASLAQRQREIGRDIETLQDMSQRLHLMKVPLQSASDVLIKSMTHGTPLEAGVKLDTLNTLVNALDLRIQTLVVAMALHREALPRRAGQLG